MVLSELGSRLAAALRAVSNNTRIDEEVLNDMLKEICNALLSADVNVKLVMTLKNNIKARVNLPELAAGLNKSSIIRKAVFEELCNLLDPKVKAYQPIKGKSNIFMMVGLQGSGKTTTVTKLAAYYKKRGFKPGVVCADTFRAGAFAQLRQNATKGKIPFYGSETDTDPVNVAREGVECFKNQHSDLIIVDTSGRHKQEEELFVEMAEVAAAVKPDCIIFVMDASIGQAVQEQAQAFKARVPVGAVIVTKLDGHAKGGGALSAVAATQSPIIFLGTGERIEDLDSFSPHTFVQRLLGLGDMQGVIDMVRIIAFCGKHLKVNNTMTKDQQEKLTNKLTQGKLTLRDLYEQLQTTMQMGPIDKMLSALPGFSNMQLPKGVDPNAKLKGFINLMDSMTAEELDCKAQMNPARIQRIARGSGRSVTEVQLLLEQYKMFQKLGKIAKPGNFGRGAMPNLRNLSQLTSKLPPGMVQQMGGVGGIQNLVRSLNMAEKGGDASAFLPNLPFS